MTSLLALGGAAVAAIAGCFAFWAWIRLGKSVWWTIPGTLSLILFAYMLTLVDVEHAGRAYAVYGEVYIVAALVWLSHKQGPIYAQDSQMQTGRWYVKRARMKCRLDCARGTITSKRFNV